LQFSHLRFLKFIRDDQRPDSIASVTTASRDGLIGDRLKAVRIGLWIS
jgi:hypothetical protein